MSDHELIIQSGLLDVLEPGDSVMADKGFIIADLLRCKPKHSTNEDSRPAYRQELLAMRHIASVRIHVERATRRVKAFNSLQVIPTVWQGLLIKFFSYVASLATYITSHTTIKNMTDQSAKYMYSQ